MNTCFICKKNEICKYDPICQSIWCKECYERMDKIYSESYEEWAQFVNSETKPPFLEESPTAS